MGAGRCVMVVLLELCFDVSRHANIERAGDVIPLKINATIKPPRPFLLNFVLLFKGVDEVVGMFLAHVFYSEVIHH